MSNIILGHLDGKLEIQSYECLVGGLPTKREWPFNYKAPFSPVDVIEEYTRPSTLCGKWRACHPRTIDRLRVKWISSVSALSKRLTLTGFEL